MMISLALAFGSLASSAAGYQLYSSPAYPYIASDYTTCLALLIHHLWISSFLMIGFFSHSAIFLIRDYSPLQLSSDIFIKIISHKASIISHLSYVSLWLGFHTLGVFAHNDTFCAFSIPHSELLIEPVLVQSFSSLFPLTTA